MSTNRWIVVGALAGVALGAGVAQAKKEPNRQVMERWFEAIDKPGSCRRPRTPTPRPRPARRR